MTGPNRKAVSRLVSALAVAGAALALPLALVLPLAAQQQPQAAAPAAAPPAAPPAAAPAASLETLVGNAAPEFSLPDQNGAAHNLAESRGKWVVLAFYPADMTAGCTLQNKSYTDKAAAFAEKGAVVYTVSTQDSKSHQEFCSKEGLKHTLLADVGGKAAAAYGVLMDNGKMAKRITFYIAPDGKVAAVDNQVKARTAADDSLATLTRLAAAPQAPATTQPGKTIDGQKVTTAPATGTGFFGGPADTKVRLNEPVADFGLVDTVSGKNLALSTLGAGKKAVVLIYVSTQCPVSNAYNERLAQLSTEYAGKGVQFIGINSNRTETPPDIAAHARQSEWGFPVLKDEGNTIADRFEARVTPEVYVTDGKGVLVYHGPIDDAQNPQYVKDKYLKNALDAVLAGQPVPAAGKRPFGCGIRRVAKTP